MNGCNYLFNDLCYDDNGLFKTGKAFLITDLKEYYEYSYNLDKGEEDLDSKTFSSEIPSYYKNSVIENKKRMRSFLISKMNNRSKINILSSTKDIDNQDAFFFFVEEGAVFCYIDIETEIIRFFLLRWEKNDS